MSSDESNDNNRSNRSSSSELHDDDEDMDAIAFEEALKTATLPWKGLLKEDHIKRLDELYGDTIIKPGKDMRILRVDDIGKIRIPGSNNSYSESKRTLSIWFEKSKREENQWWIAHLQSKNMAVLRVRDLLYGLDQAKWKDYKRLHDRVMSASRSKRHRDEQRKQAKESALRERFRNDKQAVNALLHLKAPS